MQRLVKFVTKNITEIWIAALLFIGLPFAVSLYTDYRGFILTSVILQALILVLAVKRS